MKSALASQRLKELASVEVAAASARFFKTGPGQYGEGDHFIGVKVPAIRQVAREFRGLPVDEVEKLLCSAIHEERLLALVLLVNSLSKCTPEHRQAVYDFYLARTEPTLAAFLTIHSKKMPRTMLRYAIEHYSADKRRIWMDK